MLNDDEMFYMERELTGYDWRDSAPIEYITESEDYCSDEDESDDPSLEGWDNDDDREAEMREWGLDPENDAHWDMMIDMESRE
jgi:hypothetical protein